MNTLTDLIFRGDLNKVDLDFIRTLMSFTIENLFMFLENISIQSDNDTIRLFRVESYVDLNLSAKYIKLFNQKIDDLFINIVS